MKTYLTIIILAINLTLTAQTVPKPDSISLLNMGVNADNAKKDIKEGKPKLLLASGWASTVIAGQEKFEEKYKVKYEDYGCVRPPEEEMTEYNKEVFKYLDKTYGKIWRKEIRKDVVGL